MSLTPKDMDDMLSDHNVRMDKSLNDKNNRFISAMFSYIINGKLVSYIVYAATELDVKISNGSPLFLGKELLGLSTTDQIDDFAKSINAKPMNRYNKYNEYYSKLLKPKIFCFFYFFYNFKWYILSKFDDNEESSILVEFKLANKFPYYSLNEKSLDTSSFIKTIIKTDVNAIDIAKYLHRKLDDDEIEILVNLYSDKFNVLRLGKRSSVLDKIFSWIKNIKLNTNLYRGIYINELKSYDINDNTTKLILGHYSSFSENLSIAKNFADESGSKTVFIATNSTGIFPYYKLINYELKLLKKNYPDEFNDSFDGNAIFELINEEREYIANIGSVFTINRKYVKDDYTIYEGVLS
jgi:hypothetical protein